MMRFARFLFLAAWFLPAIAFCETETARGERHVVVLVWDGMRPDFIDEHNTPALWKLAHDGVRFLHHHSVYVTATNVNGAALATGVYPNRNSLLANREFRPQIDPLNPFENAEESVIKKADEVTGGKYIASPTVAEIVRAAGRRTAVVGTKSVAFLHDRHNEWTTAIPAKQHYPKFAAAPMPASLREEMFRLLGPFAIEPSNTEEQRNTYATRALTDVMWRDGVPAFSLLWLSQPDKTQHDFAPGADVSLAAVGSSDRNLALVLDALEKKDARKNTDVFVVSDHGFSTIERAVDFPAELRKAGFDATTAFKETPKRGQIMVVGNGGTILFYVIDHDRDVTARLVEWLQRSDFAGVILAREKFEGTFSLETARVNTAFAPDVMVALRWSPKPNRFGAPGEITADNARAPGEASHASLSEYDVHNTLVAAGPDFRQNLTSSLPSSNVDIAPTVLRILGLPPPQKFDGRVLVEAMEEKAEGTEALSKTIQATRKFPAGEWQQHLRVSLVGETVYIDEGNGSFTPSP
ncbi:MAG TPA: alkaline phosphatase family protein [Chthoniobacterales bacterium]|nr:alkaline phosphatase family protein [Chthoniobacterales bacterium]